MSYKLKIKTLSISKNSLDKVIESNYLPIFAIGDIKNIPFISVYNNTSIHLGYLAPSSSIFNKKTTGLIDFNEFAKEYIIELSKINFIETINKLNYLLDISKADGIILFDNDINTDYEYCYRSILSDVLNSTGILDNKVTEFEV